MEVCDTILYFTKIEEYYVHRRNVISPSLLLQTVEKSNLKQQQKNGTAESTDSYRLHGPKGLKIKMTSGLANTTTQNNDMGLDRQMIAEKHPTIHGQKRAMSLVTESEVSEGDPGGEEA